ncbi:hypothetical protein N8587_01360 [Akkermansiaceae bacterium]|jgi:hypothetical protein|nr:hypothetical protein [Akkermansiaceae bacterium]|tara:strand:+ start:13104 stop:13397 length:294 start_codon:yes stop_codon:yes gene_type:complete
MANIIQNQIFTKQLTAGASVSIREESGQSYISVLCKTDNTGAGGITVLGTGGANGTLPDAITLTQNESITIQTPNGQNLGDLTITALASSTGHIVAM